MLLLHLILVCSGALAYVHHSNKPIYELEDAENLFESYIEMYNKQYESEQEKEMRFQIFKHKLNEINELNSGNENPHAVFDINMFSDLTQEEFESRYLGFKPDPSVPSNASTDPVEITMDLPEKFDWREHNAVTPVKNQDICGSCWTFSTTGTVEGAYAIKHKQIISLSEQQLLDCDRKNNGCNGGLMTQALKYLQQVGGAESERDYPYEIRQGQCRFDKSKIRVRVTGQKSAPMSSDDALKQFLIQNGPTSVAVGVTKSFNSYRGGIFECPATNINHAVLLVGYGKENGLPYWIIKNSWATWWGEKGYMRLKATGNPCGMKNNLAVVAEVA